jgi:hypothetical protein
MEACAQNMKSITSRNCGAGKLERAMQERRLESRTPSGILHSEQESLLLLLPLLLLHRLRYLLAACSDILDMMFGILRRLEFESLEKDAGRVV